MKLKAFINLCFLIIIFLNNTICCEGFIAGTLVATPNGLIPIEQLAVNDYVAYPHKAKPNNCRISCTHYPHVNQCIKITIANKTIYSAPNQQFYSVTRNKWIQAQNITPLEILLCCNKKIAMVMTVELIEQPTSMHTLTVQQSHVYCVSPYKIIVHNFEPASTCSLTVYMSLVYPPIASVIIAAQTIISGIACYFAYKKYTKTQTLAQIKEELKNSYTNFPSPQKPDDENEDDKEHPHGIYHDADYHHQNSSWPKSPSPKDGQRCLDYSIPYIEDQRIAIENNNFIILKQTSPKKFHGHTIEWKNITDKMKKLLKNQGYVKKSGKIIKQIIEKTLP